MSRSGRFVALIAAVGAISVAVGPPAAANPAPDDQSADEIIEQLEAQGYDVQINWVRGGLYGPLSDCQVSAIHNPNRSGEPPATFTTVYVDVACPDDWLTDLGFGFGLGTNPGLGWGLGF